VRTSHQIFLGEPVTLSDTRLAPLADIDLVITDRSIHGMLLTAALMNMLNRHGADVRFMTHKGIEFLPANRWSRCKIVFAGFPIKPTTVDQLTRFNHDLALVRSCVAAVISTHGRQCWKDVLGKSFDKLFIEPEFERTHNSHLTEAEILMREFEAGQYARQLLTDASKAKKGDLDSVFGNMVHRSMHPYFNDDTRRIHIVRTLAQETAPSTLMQQWMQRSTS